MIYGDGRFGDEPGAVGWLVGEENRGLACMFTMMNNARLMVGVQGVGQAERALQQATAYAHERRQGRAPGASGEGMSLIAEHPDVRRMLMTMRGADRRGRAICYACALAADLGARPGHRRSGVDWQARAELLTPIAKAFATDIAFEVASLGVQVHGGMGFIEETGAAQTLRDSRISPIYEGTNGIQAIDLVTRKLPMRAARMSRGYIAELRAIAEQARAENRPDFGRMGASLSRLRSTISQPATDHLLGAARCRQDGRGARRRDALSPALRAGGGRRLSRQGRARLGRRRRAQHRRLRIATARFFAERLLPECGALRKTIAEGAESVLAAHPALHRA